MRPRLSRLLCTFCALAIPAGAFSLPAAGPKQPPHDAYGDPLPPGATARFGSLRWRMAGTIMAVAVSPDGKRVASLNSYGCVAVWDMATGRQLHDLAGSEEGEDCLAFSPDGRYLATGGRRGPFKPARGEYCVRVWDVSSGKERLRLPGQRWEIKEVAFTPDGTALISGGVGQPVIVWAFHGGNKLREFRNRTEGGQPFALSPDGRWLAVREDFEELRLYAFARGAKPFTLRTGKRMYGFRFSADSRCLLTEGPGELHFWEVATGKQRFLVNIEPNLSWSAYPAPGGRKVALVGIGREIRWLDALTGKPAGSWPGPLDTVSAVAFSPDGRTVVSADGGALRVWDAAGKILQAPSGPDPGFSALAFSPDGKGLVASGADLLFLDGRTLRERFRVYTAGDGKLPVLPQAVDVSPDGRLTAAVGNDGEIVLVDARLGKVVRTLRRPGWFARMVAFGPQGKKLYATSTRGEDLRVWDVDSGKERPTLCTDLVWASDLAAAPAGGTLAVATGGPKPRCRLWDLRTGQELPSLGDAPDSVLLSRDGKVLAGYHYNSHVTVWDLVKRVTLRRFDFGKKVVTAWTFSADGRLLVTGHPDGSFATWRLTDGKEVAEVRAHPGGIAALACAPDGAALVSACTGGTVLRWEAAAWKGK
jgi:WD40 repeat protein